MLIYFTASDSLPKIVGSTTGMGLVLATALQSARAAGALPPGAELDARNCILPSIVPRRPLGGAALLDILV